MKASIYVLLLTGLAFASAAGAQQPPAPDVDAPSCHAVNWHRQLLQTYPRAPEACHEVIVSGGERWARFETQLVQVNRDGSVKSNFRNRQGTNMGAITIKPHRDQRVTIGGREYRFEELRPGQVLNVYVSEGAYAFALAPRAQFVEVVEIQQEPYVAPTRAPTRVAAAPRTLPRTAGPLPLLAIGGGLALLGGLGFTIRRRYFPGSE